MSESTHIQWTDATYNPWRGCRKVSPGCTNCYIVRTPPFRISGQRHGPKRIRGGEVTLEEPLRWNKKPWVCGVCGRCMTEDQSKGYRSCPTGIHFVQHHRRRVFCLSLGDWLDDEVPIEWLADLLSLIHQTPNLDWLLLTKRPENWRRRLEHCAHLWAERGLADEEVEDWVYEWLGCNGPAKAPRNVWLGTSVENQKTADERIPILLSIPARVRFLSVEPMLEKIDLKLTKPMPITCGEFGDEGEYYEANRGIHWAIFGGESGHVHSTKCFLGTKRPALLAVERQKIRCGIAEARPCNIEWIRDGVMQCQEAGLAVFVKQLGSRSVVENANSLDWPDRTKFVASGSGFASGQVKFKDKKGGDPTEWPEDLRIRQFPK